MILPHTRDFALNLLGLGLHGKIVKEYSAEPFNERLSFSLYFFGIGGKNMKNEENASRICMQIWKDNFANENFEFTSN